MHFQHHSKPNIIDKDPDTRIETVFLLGDTIPIRVGVRLFFFCKNINISVEQKAQANAKYGKKMPYNLQHLYFFISNKTRIDLNKKKLILVLFFNFNSSGTTFISCLFSIYGSTTCYCSTKMGGMIYELKTLKFYSIFIQDLAWLSLYYIKFFSLMSLRLGLLGAIKLHFLIR